MTKNSTFDKKPAASWNGWANWPRRPQERLSKANLLLKRGGAWNGFSAQLTAGELFPMSAYEPSASLKYWSGSAHRAPESFCKPWPTALGVPYKLKRPRNRWTVLAKESQRSQEKRTRGKNKASMVAQ